MAITYVSDGQNLAASSATSLAVTAPAGVANGDFLPAWFGWLSTTVTASAPAGFTAVTADQADGSSLNGRLLYKFASSEPASYTFSVSSAVKLAAWVGAYRGVHPTIPVYDFAVAAGVNGTVQTTPAVDVPSGGWLLYGVVTRHTPGAAGVTTWTSSGTATERFEGASNAGSADITMATYDSGAALTAATGVTRTLTSSLSEDSIVVWAMSISPADAPPVDPGSGGGTDLRPGIPVY